MPRAIGLAIRPRMARGERHDAGRCDAGEMRGIVARGLSTPHAGIAEPGDVGKGDITRPNR